MNLTNLEMRALLAVAGAADAPAACESFGADAAKMLYAFERATNKLRDAIAEAECRP